MAVQPLYLVDRSSKRVADLDVHRDGERYRGTIRLEATPPSLRAIFNEFEELVEGQVFSLMDEIDGKIASELLKVVFTDGTEESLDDLQVYPSTGRVSFMTRCAAIVTPPAPALRVDDAGNGRQFGDLESVGIAK